MVKPPVSRRVERIRHSTFAIRQSPSVFAQGWKRTFGRVVRQGWIASAILAPVALIGAWLAFQHKPAWYQPVRLDEEGYQLARRDAVATADAISDQIVQGKTFEVLLTDRSVNEWIAALPRVSPEARRALPPELHDPAVRFLRGSGQVTDERIRVGAHFEKSGWQAIVSVDLALRVSPDGINLTIALAAVRGGSLPVPRAIVERLLGPLLEHAHRRHRDHDDADADSTWGTTLDNLHSTDQLFNGVTIRNRFVWPNGRRPFRIESVRITDGELRCRLQPL